VRVSVYPPIVARRRLGKNFRIVARQRLCRNVTAVTNTHATTEELLDVLYQGKFSICSPVIRTVVYSEHTISYCRRCAVLCDNIFLQDNPVFVDVHCHACVLSAIRQSSELHTPGRLLPARTRLYYVEVRTFL
jgi:hypothetical protein